MKIWNRYSVLRIAQTGEKYLSFGCSVRVQGNNDGLGIAQGIGASPGGCALEEPLSVACEPRSCSVFRAAVRRR